MEITLEIASSLNTAEQLFWANYNLANVFSERGKFEDAQTHLERAKSHAVNSPYLLAYAMDQQARVWGGQRMFEEARSEALHALNLFEKLGAVHDIKAARQLLQNIDARRARHPG